MHINVPRSNVCSNCGSRDYETFFYGDKSGVRCRNCGHESVHTVNRQDSSSGLAYTYKPDAVQKFWVAFDDFIGSITREQK